MKRRRLFALLTLAVSPLAAQNPPPPPAMPAPTQETQAAKGLMALADLPALRVFDGLGLTKAQAAKLVAVVQALTSRLKAIDQPLAALALNAIPDIGAAQDQLLKGQTPDPARLLRLATYENAVNHARLDREDAVSTALASALGVLTPEQRALLDLPAGTLLPATPTPGAPAAPSAADVQAEAANQARLLLAWQKQVYAASTQLLEQARGESSPQRYAQAAPQAALQAAVTMTGLTGDDPMVQQLANFIMATFAQARALNEGQYQLREPQLAGSLVRAAQYVAQQHPGTAAAGAATAPVPRFSVTTADLRALLTYDRAAHLLGAWMQYHTSPLGAGQP
jgi:predicted DNA-binding protein (UPF0251 family)